MAANDHFDAYDHRPARPLDPSTARGNLGVSDSHGSPYDDDVVLAELVQRPMPEGVRSDEVPVPRKRRVLLPVTLFLMTCISTFWVGAAQWQPIQHLVLGMDGDFLMPMPVRQSILAHWDDGLVYMAALLGILFAHEMGHFLATIRYGIPASLPYFLPIPHGIGTLGAVIGMDGLRANRREMFDIGIAGPLAGLVVAIPVMIAGAVQLDLSGPRFGGIALDSPLAVRVLLDWVQPPGYVPGESISIGQIGGNPLFMAGWVGFLITGLNMLPVSQLDGGHVIYTLFGRRAHWIARGFVLCAFIFIFWAGAWIWIVMLSLVLLIGPDHPPTSNDRIPLGWPRRLLGFASLAIPVLCFPPFGMTITM